MSWTQRIAEAIKNKQFSRLDVEDAGMWDSCAVGENRIDGRETEPRDPKLKLLGNQFCEAVDANEPRKAGRLLLQIQRLILGVRKV